LLDLPRLEEVGTFIAGVLDSPYVQALVVPFIFYFVGAFGKKLIRGSDGAFFSVSDWYLAPDAVLATIGGLILQTVDLLSKFDPSSHSGKTRGLLILTGVVVCVYIAVLALHAHFEKSTASSLKKFWFLAIFANLLGFGAMCISTLAYKGVGPP
jgi:hypothetical protein